MLYANLQGREVPKSSDQLWCLWNTIMTRMGRYALRWNRGVVLDDCLIGHTHKGGSHIWYYKICQLLRANKVTDLRGESAVSVLLTTGITNCILKITLMPTGKYNSHPLWKKLCIRQRPLQKSASNRNAETWVCSASTNRYIDMQLYIILYTISLYNPYTQGKGTAWKRERL